MEFVDKEEVFAVMKQLTSYLGWSHIVMYFTAVVAAWYLYRAVKALLQGKRAEALLSIGLGLTWVSIWAVYNPRDFATLVPYLIKSVFLAGGVAFAAGLVWSALAGFKLPGKRSKHSASSQTQPQTAPVTQ